MENLPAMNHYLVQLAARKVNRTRKSTKKPDASVYLKYLDLTFNTAGALAVRSF